MYATCTIILGPEWGSDLVFRWQLIMDSALRSGRIISTSLVRVYMLILPRDPSEYPGLGAVR